MSGTEMVSMMLGIDKVSTLVGTRLINKRTTLGNAEPS
jgi:hypothetical protein